MSKQIEENPSRISFAPGNVSAERLTEVADDLGYESRAEFIREKLREAVAEHAEADPAATLDQPEHEELQTAYERLLGLSDHPLGTRPVSVEEAKDQLWTQNCPKSSVVGRLLRPLAETGYISVKNARIRVHRRTEEQVERAEAEADEALDRVTVNVESQPKRAEEHKQLRKYQRAGLDVPLRYVGWVAGRTVWSDEEVSA